VFLEDEFTAVPSEKRLVKDLTKFFLWDRFYVNSISY